MQARAYFRLPQPGCHPRRLGTILSRVLRDELHDLQRVPSGQECVASGRLVTCAKESAGKR